MTKNGNGFEFALLFNRTRRIIYFIICLCTFLLLHYNSAECRAFGLTFLQCRSGNISYVSRTYHPLQNTLQNNTFIASQGIGKRRIVGYKISVYVVLIFLRDLKN